ncbi:MAG: MgtC/SapB family protein [Clostridia bacterium]|nr:MgtC/SapB family protein [Clostridia bacterium]
MLLSAVQVVDWNSDIWHFVVRLVVSLVCGIVIGIERKTRSKEAGIRTHAIVCMAACLFMIISKYMTTAQFSDNGVASGDPTRIASTVVTGIGFLGAGIIMYRRDVMYGLTTAAGVWATAAIGMAIGSGFIVLGAIATVLILILQIIFHLPIKAFNTTHLSVIRMQVWIEGDDILDAILNELGKPRVTSYKVKSMDGKLVANVEITTKAQVSVEEMNGLIRKHPDHLLSIEHNDD